MTAKEIANDGELHAIAAAGTGFIITPFYSRWHRTTCPHVQAMNTGTQNWFAATTAELTDYLGLLACRMPLSSAAVKFGYPGDR